MRILYIVRNTGRIERNVGPMATRLPTALSETQLQQLLAQPNVGSTTGLRDRVMMEVMARAGLRVSEVVALKRTHITWGGATEKPKILVVDGKGSKDRTVPIDRELVGWLRQWDGERYGYATMFFHTCRRADTGAVSSGKHSALSVRTVQAMVRKYAEQAGLPVGGHDGVTPHVLRHTYATQLLRRRTINLEDIRRLLGHAHISTTQRYLHVTDPELEEKIWQAGEEDQAQGSLDGQPTAEEIALVRALRQAPAETREALRALLDG